MNKKRFTTKLAAFALGIVMLFAVLPSGVFPVASAAGDSLLVASVSDFHYYPLSYMSGSAAFANHVKALSLQLFHQEGLIDSLIASLQKSEAKVLLIPGDLTVDGELQGHKDFAAVLKRIEKEAGVKVFPINGNHDINNERAATWASGKSAPAAKTSPEEFIKIYGEILYNNAAKKVKRYIPPQGEKEGMLSYSAPLADGYRLIAIDAGKYKDGYATGGVISDALMDWALKEIAAAKKNNETVIGMTHWNLSPMNILQDDIMHDFLMDNNVRAAETLADAGMNFVFTGHSHVNDISSIRSDSGNVCYSVQTCALSSFPNSYRQTEFTKKADKSTEARFDLKEVDEVLPVTVKGNNNFPSPYKDDVTYAPPYRTASFGLTYANGTAYGKPDVAEYAVSALIDYMDGFIKAIDDEGGLVKYIQKMIGIDIEAILKIVFMEGVKFEGTTVLNGESVMNFLYDLEDQINVNYLHNPQNLEKIIKKAATELMSMKVSSESSSKYTKYGISGSTFGTLALSSIANMYEGNEELDKFTRDAINGFKDGDCKNTDEFFKLLIKIVSTDLVQNEILRNLKFKPEQILASGDGGKNDTVGYIKWGMSFLHSIADTSYLNLINTVLSLLNLEYGSNIDEIVNYFVDLYVTEDVIKDLGYYVGNILTGINADSVPMVKGDYKVAYSDKPIKITPTREDFRLPTLVAPSFGKDAGTQYNISWYTKASVTGTDIELRTDTRFTG
ncbi:MAG: metallophosphoesterase, partial [Oscillospiraceae bacterium]|nr:metallophosphoesterase [Oscillospiraceae bacterium]